ncbi:MAG: DUF3298 and DUF4163 domain-containing protein [Clostridium butyricum]|nr:DUF3298 and DUF4163 domain-containing protein [Clostridium butyricum]
MNDKKMDDLKNKYININIPDRLENMVYETIKDSRKKRNKGGNMKKGLIGLAASITILVGALNISPALAGVLEDVPVVGKIIKLVVIKNYTIKDDNVEASINVGKIEGLENKKLQNDLNEKFMAEGKEIYENLIKEIPDIAEGYKYVGVDYKIKSETDSILSIESSKIEVQASGYETKKHYVIDKEKQIVLTLPLMFKDSSYVDVISKNIKDQMRQQMKNDEGKIYFIDSEKELNEYDFKKINENQDFYINSDNELVICFNEYEVAPGYMGTVEFIIPKDIVQQLKNN